MHLESLYPLQNFQINRIYRDDAGSMVVQASSQTTWAVCPYCHVRSDRRHSSYQRKPQARPCADQNVRLLLVVQRYFCENPKCEHRTFAERLPNTVQFYARRTNWLNELLQLMAFEMSAKAVARVARKLQVQIGPDTILRLVRSSPMVRQPAVRVLGVDDWAFKRGFSYGTILVDLETRRPIDLLPDRTQDTLKDWFLRHPSIRIVTRDRSFEYRAGIVAGAPQARQVVDRWHLTI